MQCCEVARDMLSAPCWLVCRSQMERRGLKVMGFQEDNISVLQKVFDEEWEVLKKEYERRYDGGSHVGGVNVGVGMEPQLTVWPAVWPVCHQACGNAAKPETGGRGDQKAALPGAAAGRGSRGSAVRPPCDGLDEPGEHEDSPCACGSTTAHAVEWFEGAA